jgi:hypothetical protein
MKWDLSLLAFASLLTACRANAEDSAFGKLLATNSQECVPVAAIEAAAISPISHELLPGDKAELAADGNHVIAFLTDGSQTCARFLVPDFLIQIIEQVEGRKSSHSGGGI